MKKLMIIILVLFPLVGLGFEMTCEVKMVNSNASTLWIYRCENKEVVCYLHGEGIQCKFKAKQ